MWRGAGAAAAHSARAHARARRGARARAPNVRRARERHRGATERRAGGGASAAGRWPGGDNEGGGGQAGAMAAARRARARTRGVAPAGARAPALNPRAAQRRARPPRRRPRPRPRRPVMRRTHAAHREDVPRAHGRVLGLRRDGGDAERRGRESALAEAAVGAGVKLSEPVRHGGPPVARAATGVLGTRRPRRQARPGGAGGRGARAQLLALLVRRTSAARDAEATHARQALSDAAVSLLDACARSGDARARVPSMTWRRAAGSWISSRMRTRLSSARRRGRRRGGHAPRAGLRACERHRTPCRRAQRRPQGARAQLGSRDLHLDQNAYCRRRTSRPSSSSTRPSQGRGTKTSSTRCPRRTRPHTT